ncbi:MAG: hypothetical protein IID31_07635 [Planctomycetes bacterium]|nr:hypothetical protein [Planctomycetota bacterium]
MLDRGLSIAELPVSAKEHGVRPKTERVNLHSGFERLDGFDITVKPAGSDVGVVVELDDMIVLRFLQSPIPAEAKSLS